MTATQLGLLCYSPVIAIFAWAVVAEGREKWPEWLGIAVFGILVGLFLVGITQS
jgi:Sec-independent protein secretion pathway component TatC